MIFLSRVSTAPIGSPPSAMLSLRLANGFGHEIEMIGFNGHSQCPCPDRGAVLPISVGRASSASNMSMIRLKASSSL